MTKSYTLHQPDQVSVPILYTSPHSGRHYPPDFLAQTDLPLSVLRLNEDAYIDSLFADAPAHGCPILCAHYSRTYVDVNRGSDEIDPLITHDVATIDNISPRARAGYGVVPRLAGNGSPIYRSPLAMAEIEARLADIYRPYHQILEEQLAALRARFGGVILIDCHSMPAIKGHSDDIVLGDAFGRSCDGRITEWVEEKFRSLGYKTARNNPFSGGYTTQYYGDVKNGIHVIQIEIARALYLQENLEISANYQLLQRDIAVFQEQITADIPSLVPHLLPVAAE